MSQRDLVAELRAARVTAPAEVRKRVRLVAAADTTRARRLTWRRALMVALPVAAAVAATIVFTRPGEQRTVNHGQVALQLGRPHAADRAAKSFAPNTLSAPSRVQQVETSLSLRVATVDAVSGAMQHALRIARSYGGYPVYVDAGSQAKQASADLTLKIPRGHLREAMTRLSALGTVTAEHLDVRDLTAGINATNRTLARLQRRLAELRAQDQTPAVQRTIATLTERVARLQRQEAATIRGAHDATVSLHVESKQAAARQSVHHGPLRRLWIALEWLGIGALYVVVLGTPVLLAVALLWFAVRSVRRRREDALLSRS